MPRPIPLFLLSLIVALLAGCGQKGPLFFPPPTPAHPPAAAPAPAATAPAPASSAHAPAAQL